jgi:hypothetical protein
LTLAIAALAACSSGGSTKSTPAADVSPGATAAGTPAADVSPGATAGASATAGPSPGADEYPPLNPNITPTVELSTALAHAAIAWEGPLTPFSASDGSLTIDVPKNWHAEQREGQDFLSLAYRDDAGLFAGVSVQCSRGATVDQLITQDRDNAFGLKIAYNVQLPRATVIAGREYQEVRWTGGFTELLTDNVSFYFPGDGCTWRVQFGVYHGLRTRDYRADIETILTSLKAK